MLSRNTAPAIQAFSKAKLPMFMGFAWIPRGIPILDQQGHERFRMPDGGKLRVTSQDGFSGFCTVRYFDKERAVLFDELHESIILPIRELPDWEAANKFRLLPLDPPMRSSREPYRKGQER